MPFPAAALPTWLARAQPTGFAMSVRRAIRSRLRVRAQQMQLRVQRASALERV
jgi:hypothetical protein